MNPANLALRFTLELAAIVGLTLIGLQATSGWARLLLAAGLPTVGVVAWVIFRVPEDPSSKGHAPVEVGGATRLAIEIVVFVAGLGGFILAGWSVASLLFASGIVIHHFASHRRIAWLLTQQQTRVKRAV